MFRLLETIRIENGKIINLSYHEKRIDSSLRILYGNRELPTLEKLINIDNDTNSGVFKCRLLYSNIDFKVTFEPYKKRIIDRLILFESPNIQYDLKYADRSVFQNLIPDNIRKTEILITRKGILTDTSYTNIALEKNGNWITPKIPLLAGTQRAYLIDNGIIKVDEIDSKDIRSFSKIRLFNAMMPWKDCIELEISQIEDYDRN